MKNKIPCYKLNSYEEYKNEIKPLLVQFGYKETAMFTRGWDAERPFVTLNYANHFGKITNVGTSVHYYNRYEESNKEIFLSKAAKLMGKEYVSNDINVYIYGDSERGDEVIKMLKECGGVNKNGYSGNETNAFFYISPCGNKINYVCNTNISITEALKVGRIELKLPEKPKYKDGDMVVTKTNLITRIGSDIKVSMRRERAIYTNESYCIKRFANYEESDIYHQIVDLNIKNLEKPKKYDRVLVRNDESEKWQFDALILDKVLANPCIGGNFNECIKFDGNEHLLDKIK